MKQFEEHACCSILAVRAGNLDGAYLTTTGKWNLRSQSVISPMTKYSSLTIGFDLVSESCLKFCLPVLRFLAFLLSLVVYLFDAFDKLAKTGKVGMV